MLHEHFHQKWQKWNLQRQLILNPWYLAKMSFVHSKKGELNHSKDCPLSAEIQAADRVDQLHPTKDFHHLCLIHPLTPLLVDEEGMVVYTLQPIPNRKDLLETLHFYGYSDKARYVRDHGSRARKVLDNLMEFKPNLGVLVE